MSVATGLSYAAVSEDMEWLVSWDVQRTRTSRSRFVM